MADALLQAAPQKLKQRQHWLSREPQILSGLLLTRAEYARWCLMNRPATRATGLISGREPRQVQARKPNLTGFL